MLRAGDHFIKLHFGLKVFEFFLKKLPPYIYPGGIRSHNLWLQSPRGQAETMPLGRPSRKGNLTNFYPQILDKFQFQNNRCYFIWLYCGQ
jgi:hypothetical protein